MWILCLFLSEHSVAVNLLFMLFMGLHAKKPDFVV